MAFGLATCVGGVAYLAHKSPEEKAAYEQKRRELQEQVATKEAEERARRETALAALRKDCKRDVNLPNTRDIVFECRELARANATNPRSVSFPGMFDADPTPYPKGCSYVYVSWFEAQNAFAATVRNHYTCTYDPKDQTVSLKLTR